MAAISGQATVTAAGTAVVLGSIKVSCPILVRALGTNVGVVAIGNDGFNDVTVSNGLLLEADDVVVFSHVDDLSDLYVDSSVNGEGVSWISLEVK